MSARGDLQTRKGRQRAVQISGTGRNIVSATPVQKTRGTFTAAERAEERTSGSGEGRVREKLSGQRKDNAEL